MSRVKTCATGCLLGLLVAGVANADLAPPVAFGDARFDEKGTVFLSTAWPEDDETPLNFSSTPPPLPVGEVDGLEQRIGLAIGSLDGIPGAEDWATEGSAAIWEFSVPGGERLALSWSFLSADALHPDFAFVVLDGVSDRLADSLDAPWSDSAEAHGYAQATGWHTYTSGALAPGLHRLALGVVDVNDFVASSALAVAGVHLLPVPEADVGSLLAGSLLALTGLHLRRRRKP